MSERSDSKDIDEDKVKELEHTYLQNSMDKELNELNNQLEKKESEMKLFGGYYTTALKQHFGKKILELEEEKRTVQVSYYEQNTWGPLSFFSLFFSFFGYSMEMMVVCIFFHGVITYFEKIKCDFFFFAKLLYSILFIPLSL